MPDTEFHATKAPATTASPGVLLQPGGPDVKGGMEAASPLHPACLGQEGAETLPPTPSQGTESRSLHMSQWWAERRPGAAPEGSPQPVSLVQTQGSGLKTASSRKPTRSSEKETGQGCPASAPMMKDPKVTWKPDDKPGAPIPRGLCMGTTRCSPAAWKVPDPSLASAPHPGPPCTREEGESGRDKHGSVFTGEEALCRPLPAAGAGPLIDVSRWFCLARSRQGGNNSAFPTEVG